MLTLGVETSTSTAGVAIGDASRIVALLETAEPRRHVEFVAPAVESCCIEAGISIVDLDGIGVSVGPGLFTGMRSGIAYGSALARALDIPILGYPGLELLSVAASGVLGDSDAPEANPLPVVAVIDARRGEVFWRSRQGDDVADLAYSVGEEGIRVAPPAEAAAEISRDRPGARLVGDGALAYRDVFEKAELDCSLADKYSHPSAGILAVLAAKQLSRADFDPTDGFHPRPLYVRASDASIGWKKKDRVAEGVVIPWGGRVDGDN